MAIAIIWIGLSLGVGWICQEKTLGFLAGFLLSLILSPLVGFIISLFFPLKKDVENRIKLAKPEFSVADELEKVSKLRNAGTITEDEFQQLKSKILE